MPELPEVQTIVMELREAGLIGCKIRSVKVQWDKIVAVPDAATFAQELTGQTIAGFARRGKYILIQFEAGKYLLLHLRMTGQLIIKKATEPVLKHERVVFELDDGRTLRYHDTRKFGRFYLVNDPQAVIGKLGWEPLEAEFTVQSFTAGLVQHARQLKPLLLDQTFIAGLGNIYVDEALFAARLHPQRLANSLTKTEISALHQAIRQVLQKGIANRGTSLGNGEGNFASASRRRGRNQESLTVFRRTGQACPRCGTAIQRLIVGQRSTHICPKCQQLKNKHKV